MKLWQKILSGLSDPRDLEIQLRTGKYLGIYISSASNQHRVKLFDWASMAYCVVVFGCIMVFYTILEIVDAVENIESLARTTENLCLTITHVSGIVKVNIQIC